MKAINKKITKFSTALLIGLSVLMGGFLYNSALAADANALAAQINAISGLTATVSANTVNVTGAANIGTTRLNLNISPGVIVNWQANMTAAATANNYAFGLSGGGTLNLGNAALTNTGAGGKIYIDGAINLNINSGGLINSPTAQGSAVTIASNIQGVVINVNAGGTISSIPGGYAINDGSGLTPDSSSNTIINVTGGTVQAGSTSAIRSTGARSVVTVNSGLVTSSPASNVSPVISMNHEPPPNPAIFNVIINGGTVSTTHSGTSYVIQTSQSVQVNGGLVQALAGRAINLIGMYSVAEITGGTVMTVTGTAVSTATTTYDSVQNARIIVSGAGIVEATGTGRAIHITGINNTVNVSGGQVLARNGHAIYTEGRVLGTPVTVTGGFVFAWGADVGGAVYNFSANLVQPLTGGVVVAWHTSTGVGVLPYQQGERNELAFLPAGATVYWEVNPDPVIFSDGIRVSGPGLASFFYGLNVEVAQQYFTLTIRTTVDGIDDATTSVLTEQVRAGTSLAISARDEKPVEYFPFPPWDPNNTRPDVNGDKFIRWSGNGIFVNSNSATTLFTMPNSDAVITAEFYGRRLLLLSTGSTIISPRNYINLSGLISPTEGYYAPGELISIQTPWQRYTYYFQEWRWSTSQGASEVTPPEIFTAPTRSATIVTMPGTLAPSQYVYVDPLLSGTPRPQPAPTTTTIYNGVITGTAPDGGAVPYPSHYLGHAGSGLAISADTPPAGMIFSHWTTSEGGWFTDEISTETIFITPNHNVDITAVFVPAYRLRVIDDSGALIYEHPALLKSGDSILIDSSAREPLYYERFHWSIEDGRPTTDIIVNPGALTTIFTMPELSAPGGIITVVANYVPRQFTVEAIGGLNPEPRLYPVGTRVTVEAAPPAEGMIFDRWVIATGSLEALDLTEADLAQMVLSFDMPVENIVLIATYIECPEFPEPPPGPPPGPTPEPPPEPPPHYENYWYGETAVAVVAHNIPLTGDNNNPAVWIALLMSSSIATGAILLIKRRGNS